MVGVALAAVIAWCFALWCGVRVVRDRGPVRKLQRLAAALCCAVCGLLLSVVLVVLHAFEMVSGETLVAQVSTRWISPSEFELTYVHSSTGGSVAPQTMRLQGDQWSISGGIVKWHPWLTAIGLKSYHKPMRVSGQFSSLARQRAHVPSIYPLAPSFDPFWEALYWAGPHLPFIEAVYGSSASVYVEPGVTQEVYVTPSGYLIKKRVR